MISSLPIPVSAPHCGWHLPIVPEQYDRGPLTEEEYRALELLAKDILKPPRTKETDQARRLLARLNWPIADVFSLRHQGLRPYEVSEISRILRREMYHRHTSFWEWSLQEWVEILCPTSAQFHAHQGKKQRYRTTLMDVAYLLGGITDLRLAGIGYDATPAANCYFGAELVAGQCQRVLDTLVGSKQLGYKAGKVACAKIRLYVSTVFLLPRSPFLEDITEKVLIEATEGGPDMQWAKTKVTIALHRLNLLPVPSEEQAKRSKKPGDSVGMAPSWYAWCMAWYEQAVDIAPAVRAAYTSHLLAIGRWLSQYAPEVSTPEQWTEELALRFRADVCSWTNGEYCSDLGKHILQRSHDFGKPMTPGTITYYLTVLRRFFCDLLRRPHAIGGAQARRIRLDFSPLEVLTTPHHIRHLKDVADPRDIDLRTWARLAMAAATLSHNDLPQGTTTYPLSLYRALALLWVTSARRPNELMRLRLDCIRADVEPELLGEGDQVLDYLTVLASRERLTHQEGTSKAPLLHYLHIPSGKTRGPFYIWIPDYVVQAIEAWKQERPQNQDKLLDSKDREYVDFLFCYRNRQLSQGFLNRSLIPALCAKAGVEIEDAKGRITGHRGRSTRLTLLRSRGVSLDDLAEYAGHANTRTMRRYARQNPLQLHRIIRDADDVSRVIEGVVDLEAAAQGIPALRWFIGYDADSEPMYCANQAYYTCPHRLDCVHCGMFIGGEKARLLHEGEATLPVTSKVPMTPIEKCVVNGDQAGAETCRDALRHIPAPEAPDPALIFTPEGLSHTEMEKLARLGTHAALDKLRRALEAQQERLVEIQQSKTGRSALVGAQKKRISLLEALIVECEHRLQKEPR